jgi:hydroxyacylglutathione hydrolase
MLFRRFYDDGLAQASYLIGCQRAGEAIVVDPNMNVATYIDAAEREGMRITHVTETHIHADFASGLRTLAHATGATMHVSDEGGEGWRYAIAHQPGVETLHGGDRITVGYVHLDVQHTPGHTPEHLTFLVTDSVRSDAPVGAITGDFIFVGDVGRPDLLERAAGQAGTMRDAAATLYRSIQRFKSFPDYLQIWPGHGAGSACGKGMSAAAQSTLGYEKVANWAFEPMSETDFVERVLDGQPPAPPYFGAMKVRNRDSGLVHVTKRAALPRMVSPEYLHEARVAHPELVVLDVRNPDEWSSGHMHNATLIPLPELHTRLGELPRDRPILVHCQRGARSAKAAATLEAFGFTDVHDLIGGFSAWEGSGFIVTR